MPFLLMACSTVLPSEVQSPKYSLARSKPQKKYPIILDQNGGITRDRYPRPKLVVNSEVTGQIKIFTDRYRKFISKAYNNRQRHYEELVELFNREGLPLELLNIGVIESQFDNHAVSSQGATGIWQFMRSTARNYGLTVNFWRDERKDPMRSTWAAANHLKDLFDEFGDWNLALAGYNAGSGAVRRAIAKGGTRDFWLLAKKSYFRKQTAEYVPRFIAVSIIMESLPSYGFSEVAGELHSSPIYLSYAK